MNRIMKYAAAALVAATAVSTLGGCEQLEKKAPEDTVAVSFGDTNIMLDEVTYMIRSMEYTYESYFGSNICGNDMGDGSGMTVGDYIKQMSLSQLRQTLVLNEYAKKNGIELSDDQKAKVDEAIEKLQTESEDYLDAVGATDELIEKTYTENAIANLVYMDLVADVDTTVGDDEFLRKKIAYVKLTPSELTETTAADEATTEVSSDEDSSEEASSIENTEAESESASKDVTTSTEEASSEKASTEAVSTEEASSENVSELSSEASTEDSTEVETLSEEEQERQDAMNDAADKILKEFEEGNDAADFISDYQNDSHFTATNSEISISEDGTAVYNAAAWALSTDECTVYKSDDGSIYIIRCLDDNDEEARQSAIDSEIESRKTALFSEKYAEIQEESSKFKVDEDVIDTIRFTTPVYVEPSEEETSESETNGEETSESETGGEKTSENETSEEESVKAENSSESDESEEAVSEASSEEESK
ncbi:MAG: SurA N-terminal domain-containing protein [Clostridiales bacterium]|nr:SurA N-terminal domain-containing protein [Clostridiales bacterium]